MAGGTLLAIASMFLLNSTVITMQNVKNYVLVILFLFSFPLQADSLPRVTGLNLTGDQLSWDAQAGATGYNIHLDYGYFDTIRGGETYTVSQPGRYHVISFNEKGEFGVTRNLDESGQNFDLFSVEFAGGDDSIQYNFSRPILLVYNTCKDVNPGESCIANCPRIYQDENTTKYFRKYMTGGACSTSDIVEADAFAGHDTYSCTVPLYSGEVVAQAICLMGN